jgi:hypothetical protein
VEEIHLEFQLGIRCCKSYVENYSNVILLSCENLRVLDITVLLEVHLQYELLRRQISNIEETIQRSSSAASTPTAREDSTTNDIKIKIPSFLRAVSPFRLFAVHYEFNLCA